MSPFGLAALLTLLASSAMPSGPATQESPEENIRGLRVFPRWEAEMLAPGALAEPTARGEQLGLWLWSAISPPRRWSPGEEPQRTLEAADAWLEIRVVSGEEPLPPDLELLAAPVEMWREAPEALIPSWMIPENGHLRIPKTSEATWRLRLVGRGIGGSWLDVAPERRQLALRPRPAEDRRFTLVDDSGEAVAGPTAQIFLARAQGREGLMAAYPSDERGEVVLPALPGELEVELLVVSEGHAPLSYEGPVSGLPAALRLFPAATLEGRLIDGEDRPIAKADVRVFSFSAPGSSKVVARGTTSDETGTWRVDGLAEGEARLTVAAESFARKSQLLTLERGETLDLGALTLGRAWAAELRVTDSEGRPLTGAEAITSEGLRAKAGAGGSLRIEQLSFDTPETVTVRASGFLPSEVRLAPPRSEAFEVRLEPAFRIVGRFTTTEGMPVAGGRTTLEVGRQTRDGEILEDGTFEIEMAPLTAASLVLSAASTAELRVAIAPGEPGEARDLGDLAPPPSLTITGRLLRFEDGLPVVGGRIWAPRSADDPLFGWVRGDLLEARSDEDGRFSLRGSIAPALSLRIDAPGRARRHLDVVFDDGEASHDLGEVVLYRGCEVRVELGEPAAPGLVARLDLRGSWHESDMLTVSAVGDHALFTHVPPGPAILSLVRGHELLCDRRIDVPDGGEALTVRCEQGRQTVRGSVWMGELPVGPGWLTWSLEGERTPGLVLKNSFGSLETAEILWGGRPDVQVTVDASGYFETTALSGGSWRVTWSPEAGRPVARPLEVQLAEADEQEVSLRFPSSTVVGTVVDAERRGVAGARVRELGQGAFTLSEADGFFRLDGLEAGPLRIQARRGEVSSEVVAVQLDAEAVPPPLELELVEREESVRFEVLDAQGLPAVGALIFVEPEGEPLHLLTADLHGRLELALHPPHPVRLRAAAFLAGRWVLGPWLALEEARAGVQLRAEATGSVVIECDAACGAPTIRSAGGWDLSTLHLRLGRRLVLAPGEALSLSGLPPGSYRLTLGGEEVAFAVEKEDTTSVALR